MLCRINNLLTEESGPTCSSLNVLQFDRIKIYTRGAFNYCYLSVSRLVDKLAASPKASSISSKNQTLGLRLDPPSTHNGKVQFLSHIDYCLITPQLHSFRSLDQQTFRRSLNCRRSIYCYCHHHHHHFSPPATTERAPRSRHPLHGVRVQFISTKFNSINLLLFAKR